MFGYVLSVPGIVLNFKMREECKRYSFQLSTFISVVHKMGQFASHILQDYFDRKRLMSRVRHARPLSPGDRHSKKHISQDLLFLQAVSNAHNTANKGTVNCWYAHSYNWTALVIFFSNRYYQKHQNKVHLANQDIFSCPRSVCKRDVLWKRRA